MHHYIILPKYKLLEVIDFNEHIMKKYKYTCIIIAMAYYSKFNSSVATSKTPDLGIIILIIYYIIIYIYTLKWIK